MTPKSVRPDMIELTRELCTIKTGIVAPGNTTFFNRVSREIPLSVLAFPSGMEYNGWQIPQQWSVVRATIHKDGQLIYDGTTSPIGVAHYSRSFFGTISLYELKKHLFASPTRPDSHIWHCSWLYKPWLREWGLTPPYRLIEGLTEGNYDISLHTEFQDGEMLVGICDIPGDLPQTIVFQSNNCHPHMANDGFAGTVVMIRLFQWLQRQKNRYSYRLIICPEHLGTVFYLANIAISERSQIIGGLFGEMMGTEGPFKIATTFWGDHYLDLAMQHAAQMVSNNVVVVPFRQSVGNDETVWEAAGYEIPFLQVNRANRFGFPFPEYHSSDDTVELMNADLLHEFYLAFQNLIQILEEDATCTRNFEGLIALSNPKYNLYFSRIDPSIQSSLQQLSNENWGYLQDCIVRYFEGSMSILEIAERHHLAFSDVLMYLQRWKEKGLVDFKPVTFGRQTRVRPERVLLSSYLG